MTLPTDIRRSIKESLWAEADRLEWPALSGSDKSRYYAIWTETESIGGVLGRYMDPRQVRVYIKDTLLKPYTRDRLAHPAKVLRVLQISENVEVVATFIKPHGILFADGRHVAWSKASAWKATLMALHERAFESGAPHAAVLTHSASRFALDGQRAVVESAAEKLGVQRIAWLD